MKNKNIDSQGSLFTPVKLESNPTLETVETILNIGGVVCPFSAILGLGVGLYNKKFAARNLQIVVDRLNQVSQFLEITANYVIENERSLTFNVQKVLNAVIYERQEEKLDHYKNIIFNGINNKNFFDSNDDTIEIFTDILSKLTVDELKVAEYVFNFYDKQKENNIRMINLPFVSIKSKFRDFDEHYLNFVLRKLVNLGLLLDNTFALIGYVGQPHNFTPGESFDFRSYSYEVSPIYENFRYYIMNDKVKEI